MKRFTLLGGAVVWLAIHAAGCNSETGAPPASPAPIATVSAPQADAKGKAPRASLGPANPNVHRANP
jgi:hypothetical protein